MSTFTYMVLVKNAWNQQFLNFNPRIIKDKISPNVEMTRATDMEKLCGLCVNFAIFSRKIPYLHCSKNALSCQ
jgi:hypothetical protein